MRNDGRTYTQVAAEAGVPAEQAILACYLLNLANAGKTLDDAAYLAQRSRAEVRGYARDWGIPFADYTADPNPLELRWTKAKRGRWELKLDDLLIAVAESDGTGSGTYVARRETSALVQYGSSAEIAMRRLSSDIERLSVEIFGVDDVRIWMVGDAGHNLMAPECANDPAKLRRALAA